ncbi:sugar transferase [candidate division TA06 bacterium]|uniref:Sugar transferase n=1 Tax=candidate division TA06 bacterium TaxID=2250710 RepID=A0A523UVW4_UNCT6|nr:MAG: sugar transferase [candidate division TA06 bacterium]
MGSRGVTLAKRKERAARNQKIILIIFDLLAVSLAFSLGRWFISVLHPFGRYMAPFGSLHLLGLVFTALAWLYIGRLQGLYDEHTYVGRLTQVPPIVRTILLGMFVPFAYDYITKTDIFVERRSVPLAIAGLALFFFFSFRLILFRSIYGMMLRRGHWGNRVIVLGQGEVGKRIAARIVGSDSMRLTFVGFVDFRMEEIEATTDLVRDAIRGKNADEVVVAVHGLSHQQMLDIGDSCGNGGVRVSFVSDLFETLSKRVDLSKIEGVPLLQLTSNRRGLLSCASKRLLDIAGSVLLLLILSPLLVLCAVIIKRSSSGPALFRQRRVGLDGKEFILYKFRTMHEKADLEENENMHKSFVTELIRNGSAKRSSYKIVRDPRVTSVGLWLRKYSLDELPQLFNVLKGEMSLVGPRPPLPYELESYENWHKRRLSVRPGITGLWQVSGRSEVPFDEMVMLDLYYVGYRSMWMDISLLLKTLPAVVTTKGAY